MHSFFIEISPYGSIINIQEVFNLLHDGSIEEWTGTKERLILTVGCQYLAERINPSFNNFYIELIDITILKIEAWTNPNSSMIEDFKEIFKAELEISSASVQEGTVLITCKQGNDDLNYTGCILHLKCLEVKIYDQKENPLPIADLDRTAQEYWNQFGK